MGYKISLRFSKCFKLGITNNRQVTQAETGFPGSPKMILFEPLYEQVANVVGFLEK